MECRALAVDRDNGISLDREAQCGDFVATRGPDGLAQELPYRPPDRLGILFCPAGGVRDNRAFGPGARQAPAGRIVERDSAVRRSKIHGKESLFHPAQPAGEILSEIERRW